MGPRTEEQLAQGEGASQLMDIFHTLMSSQEAGKKLHGPLGKWRPLFSRVSLRRSVFAAPILLPSACYTGY